MEPHHIKPVGGMPRKGNRGIIAWVQTWENGMGPRSGGKCQGEALLLMGRSKAWYEGAIVTPFGRNTKKEVVNP